MQLSSKTSDFSTFLVKNKKHIFLGFCIQNVDWDTEKWTSQKCSLEVRTTLPEVYRAKKNYQWSGAAKLLILLNFDYKKVIFVCFCTSNVSLVTKNDFITCLLLLLCIDNRFWLYKEVIFVAFCA